MNHLIVLLPSHRLQRRRTKRQPSTIYAGKGRLSTWRHVSQRDMYHFNTAAIKARDFWATWLPSLGNSCCIHPFYICVSALSRPRAQGHSMPRLMANHTSLFSLSQDTLASYMQHSSLSCQHTKAFKVRLCTLMSPIGVLPSLMIKSKLWIPAKELAAMSNSLTL